MAASKHPLPGWAMLITGLMIGLFVAFLVYLNKQPPGEHTLSDAIDEVKQRSEQYQRDTHDGNKPSFDFYTILPEFEVPLPDFSLSDDGKTPRPTLEDNATYILQVASFKQRTEADSLKARLALEYGVQATIQSVTINDRDTWHRVRLGPFTDARAVDTLRNRLRRENLQPIVLKLKG
ncbi:MAG: hypothetical protein AMJ69_03845 [Gammaproteobacteria bacterium SG8_47]|nr:MAG: hypothetical protein AMJ69_03845 [Gammaproteobacteria bacterium SG8_47]